MGSKVYDFLGESFLFDDSLVSEQFSSVTEAEVLRELVRYREFCLSAAAELEQEVSSNTSNLKLFSGIRHVNLRLLKQSAFYVEQHILYDPLFELTWDVGRAKPSLGAFFGLKESPFNKKSLTEVIK